MTKIPIHDLETAPIGSREPLAHQAERLGRVINIFGAMANSPSLMEMYDLVESHLAKNSNLDNATRQAIHLTVAAVQRDERHAPGYRNGMSTNAVDGCLERTTFHSSARYKRTTWPVPGRATRRSTGPPVPGRYQTDRRPFRRSPVIHLHRSWGNWDL